VEHSAAVPQAAIDRDQGTAAGGPLLSRGDDEASAEDVAADEFGEGSIAVV
jgi:hypothetical protein